MTVDKNLIAHIEYVRSINILRTRPISGGDISKAYMLYTDTETFFCKINSGKNGFQRCQAEKEGLKAIAQTKAIAVPKVLLCENFEKGGFLLLEYIEPENATYEHMTLLGHQLAGVHRVTSSETFGWETDNFIGSLPQSNKRHASWNDFYVQERLLPQLKIARDAQLLSCSDIPNQSQLFKTCESLFPEVKPCLLHGDLWQGNYLISLKGRPCLIDPAVYYGHHEVDIAMTRLFGGFDPSFYGAYAEHFPKVGREKERCELYQLYYLLVHLNLFGGSYKNAVTAILNTYF